MLKCKNTKGPLGGNSVKNIISYHSLSFQKKRQKWYSITALEQGCLNPIVKIGYLNQVSKCSSHLEVSRRYNVHHTLQQRKRIDCLYKIIFYNDTQCSQTFNSIVELDDHLTHDVHSKINTRILSSAGAHNIQTSPTPNKIPITTRTECINLFQVKGWALPRRSKFRFNEQQRSFLLKYLSMESKIHKKVARKNHTIKWGVISHQTSTALSSKSIHCSQDGQVNGNLHLWRYSVKQCCFTSCSTGRSIHTVS